MPYCDGGSFAGANSSAFVSASAPSVVALHFRGLAIREAVLASLRANAGLGSASDVVVTGCSAGGLAAFLHTDWFAAQLPAAKTRGMPGSGWFLDGNYARDGKPDYLGRMTNMFTMMNGSAGVPAACLRAMGEGKGQRSRMLNTRGVSSFNDYKTNNTRMLARQTCI